MEEKGILTKILAIVGTVLVWFPMMATGLASGETQPAGWWWALVLASMVVYSLALVVIGVGGVLLLRDLFRFQPFSIS